jgi:hypothetical protein
MGSGAEITGVVGAGPVEMDRAGSQREGVPKLQSGGRRLMDFRSVPPANALDKWFRRQNCDRHAG